MPAFYNLSRLAANANGPKAVIPAMFQLRAKSAAVFSRGSDQMPSANAFATANR